MGTIMLSDWYDAKCCDCEFVSTGHTRRRDAEDAAGTHIEEWSEAHGYPNYEHRVEILSHWYVRGGGR